MTVDPVPARAATTGPTALVTGAGAGIGAAIARRLAVAGHPVAVTDLDGAAAERIAAEIGVAGGAAAAWTLDVTDEAAVESVAAEAEARLGPLGIAIASAGIVQSAPFTELRRADWDRVLAVNLTGTLLVFQAVARRLIARHAGGSLVAIGSVAGRGGRATEAHYAASKAGVISLVRSASLALAPHGIRANAICPGVIDTEMTRSLHEARARETGVPADVSRAAMVERIPLRRMGSAGEVAEAAAWLVSDAAAYVSGQSINVDGGLERD